MKTFTSPTVTELGSVADLTLGKKTGNSLDATFPAGTQFGQLTFS